MPLTGLRYEIDLGSNLIFSSDEEGLEMSQRMVDLLDDVERMCEAEWHWSTLDTVVLDDVTTGSGCVLRTAVDQRKFLTINFASKADAMLVRMTILDLRSVRNADCGGLPQET
jgi:hypothetical protein